MRVKLSTKKLRMLFDKDRLNIDFQTAAADLKVSNRTIRDWRAGRSSLTEKSYYYFCAKAALSDKDLVPKRLADYWYSKRAGRLGARKRLKLYGNLGTPEGRKRGGIHSLNTHKRLKTRFLMAKTVKQPKRSKKLAEFLGIIFGDGHVSNYQISVATNSETDYEHALFIKKLFKKLFALEATIAKRKDQQATTIVASSKKLVLLVTQLGMPAGNKIKAGIKIPKWIFGSASLQKAFLRGLFDTDGCVYLDKHLIKNKYFNYPGWAITSYSKNLRAGILRILRKLKLHPTNQSTQNSVYLRRREDIRKYFKIIGSSNPKHIKRYNKFIGRVA